MKRNSEGRFLLKGFTLKEFGSILLSVTIVVGIVGNNFYQGQLQEIEKEKRIEQLQIATKKYELRFFTCTKGYEVFSRPFKSNPRSEQRLNEVTNGFNKIIGSDCFRFQGDKIYVNPYKNIQLSILDKENRTSIEEEVFQGIIYEIDSGVPFLVTGGSVCADGTYSRSTGRGSCSWHGGYAGNRGKRFEFKESSYEPDPRVELKLLME